MKVKELIKELSEYDPEMEVYVDGSDATWGYGRAEKVRFIRDDVQDGLVVIEAGDADEETGE